MSKFEGLQACGQNFNDFCVTKTIQLCFSVMLFVAIFYQLCSRLRRQRQISFFVIVSIEMQISLLCNMLFCWFHTSYFLYDIQVFGFSLYFISIVYQVALRLVSKSTQMKKVHWAFIHLIFVVYILANVAVLILRLTDIYATQLCNQTWVLILQAMGILLSICMVFGGLKYEKIEKQKFSSVYKKEHLKNPMPSMWKWIAINIGCQIIGLTQSLYLQFSPLKNCTFSSNLTVQSWINLSFDLLSYHLGIFVTFWFLKKKYQQIDIIKRNSLRKDSQGQDTNNIQLVKTRFQEYNQ